MAELGGYRRAVGPEGAPALDSRSGEPERLAVTRAAASALYGQVSQMRDRAAISEGEQEGMAAGLDPEFRPNRSSTLYGEAWNRAGTRTWLDQRQNELSEQLVALSVQHEADPTGLSAAIGELQQKTVEKFGGDNFPEAEVAFAGFFSRARTTYVREALRAKTEKDRQIYAATAVTTTQRELNEIDRVTYAGGLDEEAAATAAATVENVSRRADAMVEANVWTPEYARKIVEEAKKKAKLGPFQGMFDRLKTIDEKKQLLADFNEQYKTNAGGLADTLSGDDAEALRNWMQAGINAAETDRNQAVADVGRRANSIETRAAEGFAPPEAEIAALEADAAATGDPAAAAAAELARARTKQADAFVKMTALELEVARRGLVTRMDAEGATVADAETLKIIDKVKSSRDTALSEDPYAWGARAGKISPQPALNFGSPEILSATLTTRLAARDRLRRDYGTVPFFTKAEKELLADYGNKGGAQALSIAETLVKTLGPEAQKVLGEISDDAPLLANAASLMAGGGSSSVAIDALSGLEQRKIKELNQVKITDAQEQLAAREIFGGAFFADANAEARVRATARAAWEKRARDMGLSGDLSNDPEALSLYQKTLDEAAGATFRGGVKYGGIDEVNGARVIVPPDSFEGELEQLLHGIVSLDGLAPIGTANGVAIAPQALQGATLVSAGNGRWRAALGDPRTADPRWVMTPGGDFWTVTIDQLRASRRPPSDGSAVPGPDAIKPRVIGIDE